MSVQREEAIAKGLNRYFTGEPCPHGHIALKRTSDAFCMECVARNRKDWKRSQSGRESAQRRDAERRKTDAIYRAKVNADQCTRQQVLTIASGAKAPNSLIHKTTQASNPHLRLHMQLQFEQGMSWSNYSTNWVVDHVRPKCAFDLSVKEQFQLCHSWWNLQPLTAEANNIKGETYGPAEEALWLARMELLGYEGPLFPLYTDLVT